MKQIAQTVRQIIKNSSRASQQTGFILFSRYFSRILGAATFLILIRIAGLWGFGILTLNLAGIGLFSQILNLGIPQVLIRIVPRYSNQGKIKLDLIKQSLKITLMLGFLATGILSIGADNILDWLGRSPQTILYPLLLLIPLDIATDIFDKTLQGLHHNFYRIGVRHIIIPIARLLSLLSIWQLGKGLTEISWLYVAMAGLMLILLWKQLRKYTSKGKISSTSKKNIFGLSKIFLPHSLLLNLSNKLPLFVAGFLSASTAGTIKIIIELAHIADSLLAAAGVPFAPLASAQFDQKQLASLKLLYQKITLRATVFGIIVGIIYLLLGQSILVLFKLPPGNFWSLILLTAWMLVNTAFGPNGLLLQYTNQEKKELIILAVSLSFGAIFYWILAPLWGLSGIVLAFGGQILILNLTRQRIVKKIFTSPS